MSRLYISAGKILDKVSRKRASIKTLALNGKHNGKQKIYALVAETHKYADVIERLIESCGTELKETNESVLRIMIFEHLFGKGIKGGGALKRLILKYDKNLRETLSKIKKEKNVKNNIELLPENLRGRGKSNRPRYVRVNTLLMKVSDDRFLKLVKAHGARKDEHVPNVYKFPPNTDLHDHILVRDGCLILQDKSSCFPAYVLTDTLDVRDGTVIDACAAPGNKTSHLASILSGRLGDGEIVAFDKDPKRLELLTRRMKEAGASSVVRTKLQDFLQTELNNDNVRAVLLDPSCSGSGMRHSDTSYDPERLKHLSAFQKRCLKHALSFPNVRRVTYSTCSVYREENEDVVIEVLKEFGSDFKLIPCIPKWERRGLMDCEGLTKEQSKCLLRVDPEKDLIGGFFVACFQRKKKKRKRLSKKRREKKRRRLLLDE
jgi:25S rRNA (cytosine2278-C5)-methyltransferase